MSEHPDLHPSHRWNVVRSILRCERCDTIAGSSDSLVVCPAEAAIKPAHYKVGDPYEHVKVVRAWGLNYELGCATKYIARAGKKSERAHVEDLRKAIRYIEMEIERLEGAQP